MELWVAVCSGLAALLVAAWAVRMLNWAFWEPRRLDRALRSQGLKGSSYRPISGDLKDFVRLAEEARGKPMPFSHAIFPRVSPFLKRAADAHGKENKVTFHWMGPNPRATITDPDQIREVLANKTGEIGKAKTNYLAKYFIRGLLSQEGEKWAKHRKILNPAFHIEKLKRMLPAFSVCCDELVNRWDGMAAKGEEIDVSVELQSFTGDVISRSAFGSNFEEGRKIFQLQDEQGALVARGLPYAHIPGFRFLPTRINTRMKEINIEVKRILLSIIKKREESMKLGAAKNDDLLGLLLESNLQHLREHGNAGMTTDEVVEECKLFYFAGQETTSLLLTWTMVVLSMHQDWQERAREEVLQAFGKEKPTFDGLNHLKTVTMILYEVLRLYPPAIGAVRQVFKSTKIGDVVYPPGVLLFLSILQVHHDPDFWGKDVDEFKPERFADGMYKASEKNAFFPFGGGHRVCIGQNFALLEAKLALCLILQRFSFDLSPSYTHAPAIVLTLKPQHGAPIRLRRI
ncbi:cytochrome P450 72A397-like [Zingiber officinale]|uniref:cytochrome P450 72A397-like n=1 Tax=Zingiber officinale TaxID=94328 RepID=UPI001C4C62BA|nr:cytochrome P450 72A397-like [Zingiber officinale]